MLVANIRWYKFSFPELVAISRPNRESLRLLTALLDNASFESHVRDFREENGVPEDGFDSNLHKVNAKEFMEELDYYQDDLVMITANFDLPDHLKFSMYLLLFYNSFIELDLEFPQEIYYLRDNAEISQDQRHAEENKTRSNAIMFNHQVTQNQLIEWIKKHWDWIDQGQKEYLPKPAIFNERIDDVVISSEIFNLDKEGISTREICDLLGEKYQKNEKVMDEGWVKTKLSRYKKRMKKFSVS